MKPELETSSMGYFVFAQNAKLCKKILRNFLHKPQNCEISYENSDQIAQLIELKKSLQRFACKISPFAQEWGTPGMGFLVKVLLPIIVID